MWTGGQRPWLISLTVSSVLHTDGASTKKEQNKCLVFFKMSISIKIYQVLNVYKVHRAKAHKYLSPGPCPCVILQPGWQEKFPGMNSEIKDLYHWNKQYKRWHQIATNQLPNCYKCCRVRKPSNFLREAVIDLRY